MGSAMSNKERRAGKAWDKENRDHRVALLDFIVCLGENVMKEHLIPQKNCFLLCTRKISSCLWRRCNVVSVCYAITWILLFVCAICFVYVRQVKVLHRDKYSDPVPTLFDYKKSHEATLLQKEISNMIRTPSKFWSIIYHKNKSNMFYLSTDLMLHLTLASDAHNKPTRLSILQFEPSLSSGRHFYQSKCHIPDIIFQICLSSWFLNVCNIWTPGLLSTCRGPARGST